MPMLTARKLGNLQLYRHWNFQHPQNCIQLMMVDMALKFNLIPGLSTLTTCLGCNHFMRFWLQHLVHPNWHTWCHSRYQPVWPCRCAHIPLIIEQLYRSNCGWASIHIYIGNNCAILASVFSWKFLLNCFGMVGSHHCNEYPSSSDYNYASYQGHLCVPHARICFGHCSVSKTLESW